MINFSIIFKDAGISHVEKESRPSRCAVEPVRAAVLRQVSLLTLPFQPSATECQLLRSGSVFQCILMSRPLGK